MSASVMASLLPYNERERVAIVCGPGGGGPTFVHALLAAQQMQVEVVKVSGSTLVGEPDVYRAGALTVVDHAVRAGLGSTPQAYRALPDANIVVHRDPPVSPEGWRVVDLRAPGGPGEGVALWLLGGLPNLPLHLRSMLASGLRGATLLLAEVAESNWFGTSNAKWSALRRLPTFDTLSSDLIGRGGQRLLDLGRMLLLVHPARVDCSDEWPKLAGILAERTYAVSDLAWCLAEFPGLFQSSPDGGQGSVALSSPVAAALMEAGVPTSASEHAALYFGLRKRAVEQAYGSDSSDLFIADQLPRQAAAGGMLDVLAADALAMLASDPYALVELLEAEPARMLVPGFKAYLLSAHRMFDDRHRSSQLELAGRRAGLDEFAQTVERADSQHVWSAVWARSQAVNVHRVLLNRRSPNLSVCSDADGRALWAAYSDGSIWRLHPYAPQRMVWQKAGAGAEVRALAAGAVNGQPILVAGTSDQTVTVLNADSGELIWEDTSTHQGPLSAVAIGRSATSVVIASAGVGTSVYIHRPIGDGFSSELAFRHSSEIRGLSFVSVGGRNLLFFCAVDGVVGVVDVDDPSRVVTVGVDQVVFNALHATVVGDWIHVVLGASSGNVYSLSVDAREPVTSLAGSTVVLRGTADVNTVRLMHYDGRLVVLSGASDGFWRMTDMAGGESRAVVGHAGPIWSLTVFETGGRTFVATAGGEGSCRLWRPEAALGEQIALEQANRHRGGVRSVVLFGRGEGLTYLTGGDDGGVRLWPAADINGGSLVVSHGGSVTAMLYVDPTHDHLGGRIISGAADGTLRITELGQRRFTELLGVAHEGITCLDLVRSGGTEVLASGGQDGSVILWDLKSGNPLHASNICRFGGVTSLCFSGDGDEWRLIVGGQDGSLSILDDTLSVQRRSQVECGVLSLCRVVGSDLAAVAGLADGRIALVHQPREGVEDVSFVDAHDSEVRGLASFQLAGRPVVASGGLDRRLNLLDLNTRTSLVQVDLDGYALAVAANSPWVAVGSSAGAAVIEFADNPVVLISGSRKR